MGHMIFDSNIEHAHMRKIIILLIVPDQAKMLLTQHLPSSCKRGYTTGRKWGGYDN